MKILIVVVFMVLSVVVISDANSHKNGYKGEFKSTTIIVKYLFDCEDYVNHVTAGDWESFVANLGFNGRLDFFDQGDSFTVLETAGPYTKVIARHDTSKYEREKGTAIEGWILDNWLWDAEGFPRGGKHSLGGREHVPRGDKKKGSEKEI